MLNKLRTWQKLALIALAFIAPLIMTTYFMIDASSYVIDFASQEIVGDEVYTPLMMLQIATHQHKTYERRVMKGEAQWKDKMDASTESVEEYLAKLKAADEKYGQRLEINQAQMFTNKNLHDARVSQIEAAWQSVKGATTLQASEDAHGNMLTLIDDLITRIDDTSKLILDPDLDTYYFMDCHTLRFPASIDTISGIRETVEDLFDKKTLGLPDRANLANQEATLQVASSNVQIDMENETFKEYVNFSKSEKIIPTMKPPTEEYLSTMGDFYKALDKFISGDQAQAFASWQDFDNQAEKAIQSHYDFQKMAPDAEAEMISHRFDHYRGKEHAQLTAEVLMLLLSVVLTVFIMRSITIPIGKAADVANRLARGELPDAIDVGNAVDETGMLLRSINKMLQFLDLRRTINTLQESTVTLANAVGNLEAATGEQNKAITRQAAALEETQVTAQEIKQTSQLAQQKAEAVLQVAERADQISNSGEASIEQSLAGLSDIRAQTDEIAAKVAELKERTAQVGEITQTVKDLADQSNMLALNAAIEAVRSGEHGRGFAVVAREIRSLADQSIQATNRINEILDGISASIRVAVQISEAGGKRIETGLVQVKTSGETLRELSRIVKDSSQSVRQIAAAVSQQNAGISQIFGAVVDQTKMMDNTMKMLESTKAAANVVKEVTQKVEEVVKRFRT